MSIIAPSSQSKPRSLLPLWLASGWGIVGIALILYLLVFLAWTHFHWGGEERVSLIGNLALLPSALLAGVMGLRVALQQHLSQRVRRAWLFLGIGFLLFFLGQATWTYLENFLQAQPFPSIADVFFLGFYPFVLWGLLTLQKVPDDRRDRLILALDLLSVMTSATMLVGYFIIMPTAVASNSDMLTKILASGYPISSLVLMGGILAGLYRRPSSDTRSVLLFLLTGMTLFVASDFAFGYTNLTGSYKVGGWTDAGWNIAQLFFVLAALRQIFQGRTTPRSMKLLFRLVQRLPLLTISLAYSFVFYVSITNFVQSTSWLFFLAMLLTIFIIARQIIYSGSSVASLRTKLILVFVLIALFSIGSVSFFTYLALLFRVTTVWQTVIFTTLIVLILTTSVALFLTQQFVAPISRLTAVARQIAAGDFSAKVQVESQDEIGVLATTFNSMLEALSRTQQELQDRDALYRSLVVYSPDVIMVHRDGKLLFINPAGVKLLGAKSPEELIGRPMADIIPRQVLESSPEGIEDTQDLTRFSSMLHPKIRRLDGTSFEAEIRAIPIWHAGEPATQFVLRDITERKEAEEKIRQLLSEVARQRGELEIRVQQRTAELNTLNQRLQHELSKRQQLLLSLSESENRFRLLFEASPDAILLIDPNDRNISWPIVDCNEVACTMNGYTREELIGQSVDLLHAIPGDSIEREEYLDILRQQGVLHKEGFHRHKDGQVFPIEVSSSLIRFAGRELVLGIDRDITERKQTELALQEAKELAEAASRAKSEFLSRMSHELRTPMNAILGFAQLLEMSRKEPLTSLQKDRVRQIVKGGQHLLDLINEILDISRIEANRLHISPEPVAVRESIQEVLDLTVPLAVKRQIQIVTRLDKINVNSFVMADRQRFKQVLLNLLGNAVKYNYDGGSVIITCQPTPPHNWRISIADTGPGISEENLARLFMPFERLDVDQHNVEGTGLGLVLAKRLVEMMQGQIGVESVVGRGSTFWIELPSTKSPIEGLERVGVTAELAAISEASRTVLYVEDNVANFELIRQVLADYSQIELLWAADVKAGIELARRRQPNLILLDLHLGSRDGADVLQLLKGEEATAGIPVVMVSADVTSGQAERLTALGAHAYLAKPLNVKHFIRLIEELLVEQAV